MKIKDYNSKKRPRHETKKIIKMVTKPIQEIAENLNEILIIESQSKQRKTISTKHRTTENEMAILYALKIYKNNLSNDAIASVCEKLSEV